MTTETCLPCMATGPVPSSSHVVSSRASGACATTSVPCGHGYDYKASDSRSSERFHIVQACHELWMRRYEIVTACIKKGVSMDKIEGMTSSNITAVVEFWMENKAYVEKETVSLYFSMAADKVLDQDFDQARNLVFIGCLLERWVINGEDFSRAEETDISLECTEFMMQCIQKVSTTRGLVFYLSKKLPCSCFAKAKRVAVHLPKEGVCCCCFQKSNKSQLLKCGRCKAVSYCSRECQVKDWGSMHKQVCCRPQTKS